MPIVQMIMASTSGGGGGGGGGGGPQNGDGSTGTASNNGATYTLTPSTNGMGNPGTAYPGDVITWTITSSPNQSGRTLVWWVDNNAVPVSNWAENPNYYGNGNAGEVVLDGNGSASFSLTVVQSPTHGLFRLYIGASLYQGWLTHGFIGV